MISDRSIITTNTIMYQEGNGPSRLDNQRFIDPPNKNRNNSSINVGVNDRETIIHSNKIISRADPNLIPRKPVNSLSNTNKNFAPIDVGINYNESTGCVKTVLPDIGSVHAILNRLSIKSDLTPSSQGTTGLTLSDSDKSAKSSIITDDKTLIGDVGYSFIISDKLLGHGSYGDVYLATDEHGKEIAVKCCNIDSTGIPNILEASIMGSIVHPYLNKALRIHASDTKLYIIQDLAVTDLAQYTRRDKGNHIPSIDQLKSWCYCLSQAVSALHGESIIHADIKASNILLYSDGSIKLTDYTLSTKKWSPNEKFTHNVCTCTHRPLECLMKRPWNESLDIWSLGCTFYEIAYGELLFPYQGVLELNQQKNKIQLIPENDQNNNKEKDRDAKLRLRNRSVNAIIDWSSRGPNPPTSYEVIGTTQYPIDYIPFVLCDDFKKPEMSLFNDLLCKMLIVDPAKRATIAEVLSHEFFRGFKSPVYLSVKRPVNNISIPEQARVSRYIERYTNNIIIQQLALNIYRRCIDLNKINEHVRAAVCTWISSKIVIGYPPDIKFPPDQILSVEREICHNLLFRLHTL